MKYRELGKSGIQISEIALGTWAYGGDSNWGASNDEESIRTIHKAIDLGVTLIDTAPAYGMGHGEEVVGKALKGCRDKVVLATKCGLVWDERQGCYVHMNRDGIVLQRDLRPQSIREELENSLRRLDCDYIDLYITHWQTMPGYEPTIAETMETLKDLKREGKIRAIGAANASIAEVQEYLAAGDFALVQNKYSMLDCKSQAEMLRLCDENGLTFQAYSSLERGILAGKIRMDTVIENLARKNNPWYTPEGRSKVLNMLDAFAPLCEKYGCSIANLVIAWTLAQSKGMNALCGARNLSQITDNVGGSFSLEEGDLEVINGLLKNVIG